MEAQRSLYHPFHKHRKDLIHGQDFVASQVDMVLDRQLGCCDALLPGLSLTKALVCVSIHNAANDVGFLGVQLCQGRLRVSSQIHLQD